MTQKQRIKDWLLQWRKKRAYRPELHYMRGQRAPAESPSQAKEPTKSS